MRVVVFGGTGFVGLNIAETLLAAGDEVVVFDRSPPPAAFAREVEAAPGELTVVTADIRDTAAVAATLEGADAAVNGATVTSNAARETADPRTVLEVNLLGWLGVLEGARRHGLRRLVNLSSASAYGAAAFGDGPLAEDATAADPDTLYSISKFAGERVARRLRALWALDVLSVRLSSVFGPWERGTGVRDTLSPPFQVMRAALGGEPVRLERADRRDWVYAPDVARAVRALLAHPAPAHTLYNVAPGDGWALADWATRLAEHHFPGLEVAVDPAAPTIATHMAEPRQPLRVDRLRDDVGLDGFPGLEATADHYATWAKAHRDVVAG